MTAARRGFTLVEVLVALVIMAVLALMAWQGVDGIVRARDISRSALDRTLRLSTVVAQWDADLQALYDSAAVPALRFDGATLRLVRTVPGGVQLVAWSLRGTAWQRWAGPAVTRVGALQDSWLRSQQLLGNEPEQVTMLDGVGEVQVYFFRGNAWSNAQSTGDVARGNPGSAAAAAQQEQLPEGVRLVLALGDQRLTRDLVLAPQLP